MRCIRDKEFVRQQTHQITLTVHLIRHIQINFKFLSFAFHMTHTRIYTRSIVDIDSYPTKIVWTPTQTDGHILLCKHTNTQDSVSLRPTQQGKCQIRTLLRMHAQTRETLVSLK
jgi:hypothetical protein